MILAYDLSRKLEKLLADLKKHGNDYKIIIDLIKPMIDGGFDVDLDNFDDLNTFNENVNKPDNEYHNILLKLREYSHNDSPIRRIANYLLGFFYEFGIGTDKDIKIAYEFYERSAHDNYFEALVRIADGLRQGDIQNDSYIVKNIKERLKLLKQSEKQKSVDDLRLLALAFEGNFGVKQNILKSLSYYLNVESLTKQYEERVSLVLKCFFKTPYHKITQVPGFEEILKIIDNMGLRAYSELFRAKFFEQGVSPYAKDLIRANEHYKLFLEYDSEFRKTTGDLIKNKSPIRSIVDDTDSSGYNISISRPHHNIHSHEIQNLVRAYNNFPKIKNALNDFFSNSYSSSLYIPADIITLIAEYASGPNEVSLHTNICQFLNFTLAHCFYRKDRKFLENILKGKLLSDNLTLETLKEVADELELWVTNPNNQFSRDHESYGLFLLGFCYRFGLGVVQNEKQAFDYFKLSAEQYRNPYSIIMLSVSYMEGIGIEKNEEHATEIVSKFKDNKDEIEELADNDFGEMLVFSYIPSISYHFEREYVEKLYSKAFQEDNSKLLEGIRKNLYKYLTGYPSTYSLEELLPAFPNLIKDGYKQALTDYRMTFEFLFASSHFKDKIKFTLESSAPFNKFEFERVLKMYHLAINAGVKHAYFELASLYEQNKIGLKDNISIYQLREYYQKFLELQNKTHSEESHFPEDSAFDVMNKKIKEYYEHEIPRQVEKAKARVQELTQLIDRFHDDNGYFLCYDKHLKSEKALEWGSESFNNQAKPSS